MLSIITIEKKSDERFLRKSTLKVTYDPTSFIVEGKTLSRKDLFDLIRDMKKTMYQANGIGLSANQIHMNAKFFIAQVPDNQGNSRFYAVFNPIIEKLSKETEETEEGCLSIPGVYGTVPRARSVILTGLDKSGKPLKIKAWGLLARVFQHEVDHLAGKLFIDRATKIYNVPESDRLIEREEKILEHSSNGSE